DRRRVANFDWSDPVDQLEAQGAIEKEDYVEAFRPLWRNLVRAHSLGSWRAVGWAAERYGRLCLKVGALEEGCHFLVIAQAEKQLPALATMMGNRRDRALIRAVLRHMLAFANLRRHFIAACRLLANIPDLIPDDQVSDVSEWLLPRCKESPTRNGGGVM